MKTKTQPEVKPVSYPEVRQKVETYYAIQHLRIQAGNRLGAYERMGLDSEKSKAMHNWIDERLHTFEAELKKMIEKEVVHFPIYEKWLLSVRGIGPALSGSLVAWIGDIGRFDNISKLWRYCGQSVKDGQAERRKAGEKIAYSPILKTTCWKIGEQFVKQGEFYREIYDRTKKRLREIHPEKIATDKKNKNGEPIFLYSDGHIHAMAKRKAVKHFLADLWLVWRKMEGLPVTKPYVIDVLGHKTFEEPKE